MEKSKHAGAYIRNMARLTRSDWQRAAWARLTADGIDGVRVEALARDLGATKGSFYWHFDDRESLFASILEYWEALGTDSVIEKIDALSETTPQERLRRLLDEVFDHPEADAVEVGIRAWARHHDLARATVARVDARRVAYVTHLLVAADVPRVAAELRATILYRALIGDFTVNAHGGGRMGSQAIAEIAALALSPVD